MAVRFIIGRAGTGKSRHCLDRVVTLLKQDPMGPPVYWIVPKQATFQTERELAAVSELKGFSRARIVSFQWLGEEILETSGGAAIPLVSGNGRQMVLGHLLRKHADALKFYRSSATQAGLASQLDLAFTELEHQGYLPDDLIKSLEVNQSDPATLAKLRDLAKLYQLQRDFLGQQRLDPARRMEQVIAQLHQCRQFAQADVLIDNFIDFSDHERKLIAGLSKVCRQVDVTLTMDPDAAILDKPHLIPKEMCLFRRSEEAYRKLRIELEKAQGEIEPPIRFHVTMRFACSATLQHVEEHLMEQRPAQLLGSTGVEMVQAFDRRGEVSAAARQIRQWMSEGLRYREIAVLVRSIDHYQDWVAAAFDEHDIPYFVDRRRPASYHPLTRLARAIVSAVVNRFDHDDMMTLLKCGLAGISSGAADALENYVLEHRVRNEVWIATVPWKDALGLRNEDDDLPRANAGFDMDAIRRRLVAPLTKLRDEFGSARTHRVSHFAAALYRTIEAMKTRESLEEWITTATSQGDLEQAAEHQQVWNSLVELLDQMVDLLGEEQVSPADFLTILESGLEGFDLALTPPTLDQVLVGDVNRTRTPDIKAVILLGLNEGEFPRRPGESSIFSDRERIALDKLHITLDPASDSNLLAERFLAYFAFTRASERLTVMRFSCNDAGCELAPSIFWEKLRATLPDVKVRIVKPEHQEQLHQIGTKQQLSRYLMTRVRAAQTAVKLADEDAALYQWLACSPADPRVRFAWQSLSYENRATLGSSTAHALFPAPLQASVSRIETYAACPFKHFARYGLHLRARDESEITPLRLGTIYHGVLERYVRRLIGECKDWSDAKTPEAHAAVVNLTDEIARKVIDTILIENPRSQYLLNYVRETVHRVLLAQLEASNLGNTAPLGAELSFGFGNSALPAFKMRTPRRRHIELNGKIDRVDMIGEDGFAIIDYKTGDQKLNLNRVLHGLSLQLLTYLMVAHLHSRSFNHEKKRLFPAGALYLKLVRGFESSKDPREDPSPDEAAFHLAVKPRGMVHANYLTGFDGSLGTGSSQVICAFVNQAGELGHRGKTDTLTTIEFRALMRAVRRNIKLLSDRIMDGEITVRPYRIGTETPCSTCEYRSVCRFDVSTHDTYLNLEVKSRENVLKQLAGDDSGTVPEGEGDHG